MSTDHLTESQHLEQRITQALVTIRREWPGLRPAPPSWRPGGGARSALITADDHRTDGKWNVLGDRHNDVDAATSLASIKRTAIDVLGSWSREVVDDRILPSVSDKSRREIREHLSDVLPHGQDVNGLCRFLERHASWMSHHEAGEVMADELRAVARSIEAYVSPPPPAPKRLCTCPLEVEVDGQMVPCGGSVRYYEDVRDGDGQAMPTCDRCGVEAVSAYWEGLLFDNPEARSLLTYDEVAMLAHRIIGRPVARQTVKMWANRGIIEPSGDRDEMGRVLFAREATVFALDKWKRKSA